MTFNERWQCRLSLMDSHDVFSNTILLILALETYLVFVAVFYGSPLADSLHGRVLCLPAHVVAAGLSPNARESWKEWAAEIRQRRRIDSKLSWPQQAVIIVAVSMFYAFPLWLGGVVSDAVNRAALPFTQNVYLELYERFSRSLPRG